MLGLPDRGMIKKGFAADLVIFDPKTISDKSTFTDPHHYSEGIVFLFVNGEHVIENGEYNGTLAGKTLRMNRKQSSSFFQVFVGSIRRDRLHHFNLVPIQQEFNGIIRKLFQSKFLWFYKESCISWLAGYF